MILLVFAYWMPVLPAGGMVDTRCTTTWRRGAAVRRSARASRAARRRADAAHDRGDRPLSARGDARGAAGGLHPHRAREGRARARRSSGATRCAPRSRRWSRSLGLLLPGTARRRAVRREGVRWPGMGLLAADAISDARLRSRHGDGDRRLGARRRSATSSPTCCTWPSTRASVTEQSSSVALVRAHGCSRIRRRAWSLVVIGVLVVAAIVGPMFVGDACIRAARHRRAQERAAVVDASVRHRSVQPRSARARAVRRADLARRSARSPCCCR